MDTTERLKRILRDSLQLGGRVESLVPSSRLLGGLPEFDSMAVVSVLTMIEAEFGIVIEDDDVSAETFQTLGTLTAFVEERQGQ